MAKMLLINPIGIVGQFKPIYLETGRVDERDGKYCEVVEASFWKDGEGSYGELLVKFIDDGYMLTIGSDEFDML